MIWLTADHHFNHANIIEFCHRPFLHVTAMDEALITAWNSVVKSNDVVYHLGDFSLDSDANGQVSWWFRQLNGTIHLLGYPWHHDGWWLRKMTRGLNLPEFPNAPNVVLEPPVAILNDITLCHFPFEVWNRRHYGWLHAHGHSHGNLPKLPNRLDVGVDNAYKLLGEYRPFSMEEFRELAA